MPPYDHPLPTPYQGVQRLTVSLQELRQLHEQRLVAELKTAAAEPPATPPPPPLTNEHGSASQLEDPAPGSGPPATTVAISPAISAAEHEAEVHISHGADAAELEADFGEIDTDRSGGIDLDEAHPRRHLLVY